MPGPDKIPLGVLAYYTADIAPTAPSGTTAKWSVIEPGRKPRSLGKSLTLTYAAQRHLVGKTIKVRSLLTEAGAGLATGCPTQQQHARRLTGSAAVRDRPCDKAERSALLERLLMQR